MYEEFPANESLFEYVREDKVMKLSLPRLKNKVQEGEREVKSRKEAKTKNYWKTRCSRHTFTILAISWAYGLRLTPRSRPRNRKKNIYNLGICHFLQKGSNRSVIHPTDRLDRNVTSSRSVIHLTDRLDLQVTSNRSVVTRNRSVGQLVQKSGRVVLPHSTRF